MSNKRHIVTINKRTQWQVTDRDTGVTKNFWTKSEAEEYLDIKDGQKALRERRRTKGMPDVLPNPPW